jgi:hypothetical protein
MIKWRVFTALGFALGLAMMWAAGPAAAEKVDVSAVLAPVDSIKLDFEDGSKRFVLFVQREGKAEGHGLLAGADVTEYGMHDLIKGVGGKPRGYLVYAMPGGDKAYIKWTVRAIFVKEPGQAKPKLLDYGVWEVAGGTGAFAKLQGVGTMTIKPASKTDRRFTLTGDLVIGE